MADSDEDLNERVNRAAEEIYEERNAVHATSEREICREYQVPRDRVRRGLQGMGPRFQGRPAICKLSTIQEQALKHYIFCLEEIGVSVKQEHVRCLANCILKKAYNGEDSPPTVGEHWLK